jgi:nitrate reductase delta subunit
MLQSFEKRPEYVAAVDRVKAWTRKRFQLADDATIFVAEVSCALPGCPPRETVIVFWTAADTRHQFKVFKPAAEVVREDLPPTWLKNALIVDGGAGWECC